MRGVAWWGAISAVAAPVLLIGGWTVAGGLQPQYDPVADTVSALAAIGATDRWVMSLVFVLVGACYVLTALALRAAKTGGRLILIAGAIAGMLVAANPEHAGGFGSVPHFVFASLGFAGLTFWPLGAATKAATKAATRAARRAAKRGPAGTAGTAGTATSGPATPWGLHTAPAATAVAVQFALLAWFGAELIMGGGQVGLAERVMGGAQATWPLAVVLSCYLPVRIPVPAKKVNQTSNA